MFFYVLKILKKLKMCKTRKRLKLRYFSSFWVRKVCFSRKNIFCTCQKKTLFCEKNKRHLGFPSWRRKTRRRKKTAKSVQPGKPGLDTFSLRRTKGVFGVPKVAFLGLFFSSFFNVSFLCQKKNIFYFFIIFWFTKNILFS